MKQDPHICSRCAACQETCCQLEPGTEADCFALSAPEKERLLGAGYTDFWQREKTSSAFLRNMYSLFPYSRRRIHEVFPLGGVHDRLATRADGRCVLLGDSGCLLPREIRPWYCRLFPFWVVSGKVSMLGDSHCLVVRLGVREGLRALDMPVQSVIELYTSLVDDWGLAPVLV